LINRWASSNLSGKGDVFTALHAGLTINLISTPSDSLTVCTQNEPVSDVLARSPEDYDFIPVVDDNRRFVGMFNAFNHRGQLTLATVWQSFVPLSEENLIGADASILDFVVDADQRPCRLVIAGANIIGLVSLSDLQRLPARAALFALITGFEITMAEFIQKKYLKDVGWLGVLAAKRQQKIKDEMGKTQADNGYVESLLFTQFCDKTKIVSHQFPRARREVLEISFRKIEQLRNQVAHANEYASSPIHAKHVCKVVRELLELRDELQNDLLA
jgi:hypothetical protein